MEAINVLCVFCDRETEKTLFEDKGVGMTLTLIKKNKEQDKEEDWSVG